MVVDERYSAVEASAMLEQAAQPIQQANTAWLGRAAAGPVITFAREVGDAIGNSAPGVVTRLVASGIGNFAMGAVEIAKFKLTGE